MKKQEYLANIFGVATENIKITYPSIGYSIGYDDNIIKYYINDRVDVKKIPDDLSIIGSDDIKEVTYVFPALTTVRQNIEEKGRIVMETLKEAIENENFERKIIEVKTELIVRNSTKKYE